VIVLGVVAMAVGCRAHLYKVRQAKTTLCAKRVAVVVESIESLQTNLLHEPLVRRLGENGAEARVVEGDVASLRDPRVAATLNDFDADALLVVDVKESMLMYDTFTEQTNLTYELSLYEYTDSHDLIEVWDAKARTMRRFTADRSVGNHEANVLAQKLAEQIRASHLLWPCEPGR
jgi:hypothetical protein